MTMYKWPKNVVVIARHMFASYVAELFFNTAIEYIDKYGFFFVALPGGSTPSMAFQQIFSVDNIHRLPWDRVHFFFSDERLQQEGSNYSSMLDHAEIIQQNPLLFNIYKPPRNAQSADVYSEILPKEGLHLAWLGVGEDGHVASLFHTTKTSGLPAILTKNPNNQQLRMSLSIDFLLRSHTIFITATGKKKHDIVNKIFNHEEKLSPAYFLSETHRNIKWIVDNDVIQGGEC